MLSWGLVFDTAKRESQANEQDGGGGGGGLKGEERTEKRYMGKERNDLCGEFTPLVCWCGGVLILEGMCVACPFLSVMEFVLEPLGCCLFLSVFV